MTEKSQRRFYMVRYRAEDGPEMEVKILAHSEQHARRIFRKRKTRVPLQVILIWLCEESWDQGDPQE